jgi:hemerythrin-like domain-containing protein
MRERYQKFNFNEDKNLDDFLNAGMVLAYINARHFGNVKEAKNLLNDLKKKLKNDFNSFLMKFGDPDKSNNFEKVRDKWIQYIESLKKYN